jgi:hypothetical protein
VTLGQLLRHVFIATTPARVAGRHVGGVSLPLGHAAWRWTAGLLLTIAMVLGAPQLSHADNLELPSLEVVRSDDGVLLSFVTRFELPRAVEDAMHKGVPLHFVARVEVYRSRWYWTDRRLVDVSRTWRLAYQPLTRKYRVTFGSLNQTYDTLPDAMAALRRVSQWKVAETAQLENDAFHYLEFSYRLDTSQLPRPMQIGITGQSEWSLMVERTINLD